MQPLLGLGVALLDLQVKQVFDPMHVEQCESQAKQVFDEVKAPIA